MDLLEQTYILHFQVYLFFNELDKVNNHFPRYLPEHILDPKKTLHSHSHLPSQAVSIFCLHNLHFLDFLYKLNLTIHLLVFCYPI